MNIFVLQVAIEILIGVMNLIEYLLIGYIILGWFVFFGAVKDRDGVFFKIFVFLMGKIEPVLSVIRRFLPPVAGFDFSAIVVFFGIYLVKVVLIKLFYISLAYG
ncbi:MAG: YggT family protein [Holosporales bacterium]|jgi:YggT family protein|nr:YggT family protein [Holosporales bacterium]